MPKQDSIHAYEHPFVTVDSVVFTIRNDELAIALIERGIEPHKGMWALPGGFVRSDESLDAAARRELCEEVGMDTAYMEQLYTFGEPGRDPRDRVVTVAYYALVREAKDELVASSDAKRAAWFPVSALPLLAFDHAVIIRTALERIRGKLEYSNVAFGLLPEKFRLSELQRVYEVILGQPLDKRNFRKKMLSLNLLEATDEKHADGAHRPATLYRFKESRLRLF